jgi:hypothetical protein
VAARHTGEANMAIEIDSNNYDAITFDCYGTLIDWEAGLTHYL